MFQRLLKVSVVLAALPVVAASGQTFGQAFACHGECYEKVRTPDVYATLARPVVVAPARSHVVHSPEVLGTIARSVEVAPARAYTSYSAPVYGTVARDVVVAPGGYRWERRSGRSGREEMCKVYVPPVTRTVHEPVLVEPARRVVHVTPAVRREVHRTVVLQPAARHVVHTPAVVAYERQDVLVQKGGTRWARTW